ncbi:hypothetical protein [Massilia niabensis]|uniref:Uncharacterized protein n=1 Tax=Massilia niabensis TaxID=544910 RepID=A0ABW0LAE0_9BURK
MSSLQSSASRPASRLWSKAVTLVQNIAGRLVVPVSSTEEMSDVWKLYRLTPASDTGLPAAGRERASSAER